MYRDGRLRGIRHVRDIRLRQLSALLTTGLVEAGRCEPGGMDACRDLFAMTGNLYDEEDVAGNRRRAVAEAVTRTL